MGREGLPFYLTPMSFGVTHILGFEGRDDIYLQSDFLLLDCCDAHISGHNGHMSQAVVNEEVCCSSSEFFSTKWSGCLWSHFEENANHQ
jgi:hypothetical protein